MLEASDKMSSITFPSENDVGVRVKVRLGLTIISNYTLAAALALRLRLLGLLSEDQAGLDLEAQARLSARFRSTGQA